VIPGWRPEIRDAFNDLVRAFGDQGYPEHELIASTYIHGISLSRGEEFWLDQTTIDYLELNGNFSPQALDDWITSRMDAYAEAFAGVEYKLAWVGKYGVWSYCETAYADLALQFVQHAWDIGAGNRSSAVERYHLWPNEPALGQAVDENGYLTVDESIPPIAGERCFGDENEEYGDAWVWRFGSRAGEAQRYRFSMLRALQMRTRFLWTSTAAEEINPPLSVYAEYSFGKNVHTSPDAWCYLKETPVGTYVTPAGVIRNFERWLLQRDVPGGVTVATERVEREFNAGGEGDAGDYFDYVARRTDIANDNPYIYFDLDDRFSSDGPIAIKVELRDSSSTSWWIEYMNADSQLTATPAQETTADGEVRTVTFTISDAQMTNGLPHDMDFRIVCGGSGDLSVRWVRLLRHSIQ